MDCIELTERPATAEEFMRLRNAVGWGCPDAAMIEKGLRNNLYSVCAELGGSIVGYGRIIGDGAFALYIQDIMILPEYQRQGIGMMIMTKIMKHIKDHYGKGTMVNLMAAKGKEEFGFSVRPDDRLGCGMTQWL